MGSSTEYIFIFVIRPAALIARHWATSNFIFAPSSLESLLVFYCIPSEAFMSALLVIILPVMKTAHIIMFRFYSLLSARLNVELL
jgi:hypothetical protein